MKLLGILILLTGCNIMDGGKGSVVAGGYTAGQVTNPSATPIQFSTLYKFSAGTANDYTVSPSLVQSLSGSYSLSANSQSDSAAADFAAGSSEGVIYNSSLKLGAGASNCDGTISNCTALNSGWAPQWSKIVGYWHGGSDWLDVSGNSHNGTPFGGVSFSSAARVGASSANFSGWAGVDVGTFMPSTYTKSAWIYVANGGSNNIISGGGDGQHAFWVNGCGSNRISGGHNNSWGQVCDPASMNYNTWYHVAITYDAATTTMKLYKNGQLVDTNTNVPPFNGGNRIRLGAYDGSNSFSGNLEELTVWSVPLAQNEIQSLYQHQNSLGRAGAFASRVMDAGSTQSWSALSWTPTVNAGAWHIKFQVRACVASDCSASTDQWQGPDGTANTFFSDATANAHPSVNLSALSQRYFQYQAVLETATASVVDFPEFSQVDVAPAHYDATAPSIVNKNGSHYSFVLSLKETLGAASCSGVTYSLGSGSTSGTASWYYWKANVGADCTTTGTGHWCQTTGLTSESNDKTTLNANLSTFAAQVGTANLYFKAYLNSNGQTACELSQVELDTLP